MKAFAYRNAETIEEAVGVLTPKRNVRKVIAGGIDLLGEMKERIVEPEQLVNIKTIPGLDTVLFDEKNGLRLGALATLAAVHRHEVVQQQYPAIAQGALSVGTPQIRNVGTVGGNLCQRPRCWYYRNRFFRCLKKGGDRCYAVEGENKYHAIFGPGPCHIVHPSDLAPPLMAYGGRVQIVGPSGFHTVSLDEFFTMPDKNIFGETILQPNEIVTQVEVPPPPPGSRSCYLKIREKASLDFALASVAAVLAFQDGRCLQARIVLGGAAPIPWRLSVVEALIVGKRITASLAREAGELAVADAEPMAQNSYKVPLFRNLISRVLLQLP